MFQLSETWRRLVSKSHSPAQTPSGARYWAFLSYSRKDVEWAKWLQRRIEAYSVTLPGSQESPNRREKTRLFPLFRDEDEASASDDLGRTLRDALEASHALIVICSPAAAASKWVNEEIATFRKTRAGRPVVAVIVDGEPNAGSQDRSEEECFPEALRSPEPLAADFRHVRGHQRYQQLMKVIAALTGLPLDDLIKRDRRRRYVRTTSAAGIALLATTVGGTFWLNERRKTDEQAEGRRIEEYRAHAASARELIETGRPWDALDRLLASVPQGAAAERVRARVPAFDATIRMALLKSRVMNAWPGPKDPDQSTTEYPKLLPHPDGSIIAQVENREAPGDSAHTLITLYGVDQEKPLARVKRKSHFEFAAWIEKGRELLIVEDEGKLVRLAGDTLTEISSLEPITNLFMFRFLVDTPHERLIFVSNKKVHLWGYKNNSQAAIDLGPNIETTKVTLARSADGERLAVGLGNAKEVRVYSTKDVALLSTIAFGRLTRLSFDAKGERLVVSATDWGTDVPDAKVGVFDAATGKELWSANDFSMVGESPTMAPGGFQQDDREVIVMRSNDNNDRTAQMRALDTGEVLGVLRGFDGRIQNMAFDGWLGAVEAEENRIRVHSLGNPEKPRIILGGHGSWPFVQFAKGRTLVSRSTDDTDPVIVWNARLSHSDQSIGWDETLVCHHLDDRTLLTGHAGGTIRSWELPAMRLRWKATTPSDQAEVDSIAGDAAGKFVLAVEDHKFRIIDADSAQTVHTVMLEAPTIATNIAAHPTQPVLALILANFEGTTITSRYLAILDLPSGKLRPVHFGGFPSGITWVDKGNRLVVENSDSAVGRRLPGLYLLDSNGREVVEILRDSTDTANILDSSADLIVHSDTTIHTFDASTGTPRGKLKVVDNTTLLNDHAYDPTRKLLAVATTERPLVVLDIAKQAEVAGLPALPLSAEEGRATGPIEKLKFADDGLWIGLEDGRICRLPFQPQGHAVTGAISCSQPLVGVPELGGGFRDIAVLDGSSSVMVAYGGRLFTLDRATFEQLEAYDGCEGFCELRPMGDGKTVIAVSRWGDLRNIDRWQMGPVSDETIAHARRLVELMKPRANIQP